SLRTQRLQVRASLPVWSVYFLPQIRGGPNEDQRALGEARRAYEQITQTTPFPKALSNLAVLEAYAADYQAAEQHARAAVAADSSNPELRNNLGVVLYLEHDLQRAKGGFERAAASDADVDYSSFVFNLAKALHSLMAR